MKTLFSILLIVILVGPVMADRKSHRYKNASLDQVWKAAIRPLMKIFLLTILTKKAASLSFIPV